MSESVTHLDAAGRMRDKVVKARGELGLAQDILTDDMGFGSGGHLASLLHESLMRMDRLCSECTRLVLIMSKAGEPVPDRDPHRISWDDDV